MDLSTPIDRIRGGGGGNDENPEMVNSILEKYDTMNISPNQGYEGDLPPLNPDIPVMERDFENRSMNDALYNMQGNNPAYMMQEQQRMTAMQHQFQAGDGDYDDGEEEEIEYEEIREKKPWWKRFLNEIKIILIITIMILFFFNSSFDRLLTYRIPFFRQNISYDCNHYGIGFKAIMVGLIAYGLIKFVRF